MHRDHVTALRMRPSLGAQGCQPNISALRTFYATLAHRTGTKARTLAAGGTATAALGSVPVSLPLLIVLAVLAGVVRGNLTLLQATEISDRWGTISTTVTFTALLAAPDTVSGAFAPWARVVLATTLDGYPASLPSSPPSAPQWPSWRSSQGNALARPTGRAHAAPLPSEHLYDPVPRKDSRRCPHPAFFGAEDGEPAVFDSAGRVPREVLGRHVIRHLDYAHETRPRSRTFAALLIEPGMRCL